jgi:hypothetical protein
MSALSIQPTFPIFTETDGLPLENGYIWIGAANLDPQGNPINVYWDAALTIAAPQPIRTLNGYPSRSGTPARLYVNSDYSIRVQNSKGSVVYSAPQATERVSSNLVTFVQTGSGAVERTVEDKLRETVSVLDFGADPTGVANSSSAFAAALAASDFVYVPEGTYTASFELVGNKIIEGAGNSSVITAPTGSAAVIYCNITSYYQAVRNLKINGNDRASKGLYFGTGNQAQHAFAVFENLDIVSCSSGFDFDRASYFEINNCVISYCDTGVGGEVLASAVKDSVIFACDNAVDIANSSYVTFDLCTLFTEINQVPGNLGLAETLAKVIDSHHIYFRNCDFEPQTQVTTAQVLLSSSSSVLTDVVFDNCWFLQDFNAARNADCVRLTGSSVSRVYFNNTQMMVVAVPTYAHINIQSSASTYVSINNSYFQTAYSSASTSALVILNPNSAFVEKLTSATSDSVLRGVAITNTNSILANGAGPAFRITDTSGSTGITFDSASFANDCAIGLRAGTRELGLNAFGLTQVSVGNGAFFPTTDNTKFLGLSANRWSVVYAGTGTINTSDEREKQDIAPLDAAEKRVAVALKGLVKKFKFKDAVQVKGDGARIHIGVIAQEVISAFESEGLDPMRYAIVCYDEWKESPEIRLPIFDDEGKPTGETKVAQPYRPAGNRYGVRYEELLAFIIFAS